jgi:glycosyltransferase involved in cell wall biosynthesis
VSSGFGVRGSGSQADNHAANREPRTANLHLAFLYPQLKKLTGAQRLILQLARYTVAAGHRVTLVTHQLRPEPRTALAPGVRLVQTGMSVDRFGQHYLDAAREYALAPALIQHIPVDTDALICFGPPSMPALWWARRRGWGAPAKPLLAFLYEPPRFVDRDRAEVVAGMGRLGKIAGPFLGSYSRIDRALVRAADGLLANGDYGAERLRAAYGRDATVVPHGVDFAEASEEAGASLRARWGIPVHAPVILGVNQLHPRKRLDLFIGTVAKVRAAFPEVYGVLVGRGVDESRLRAEAARLGIADRILFAGFVPEDDLPAVYRAATIYLHTGRDETFGLSVLEAAWSGVPVVAVDEGGPHDILRGGELGVLAAANVADLTGAVRAVLEAPEIARQMAVRARADVRARFRWEAGAAALIGAVEGLRGASAPGS